MKTTLEKKAYFKNLREQWKNAKVLSEDPNYKYKYNLLVAESPNMRISMYSFSFVLQSMEQNGFSGLPYIDCKTYKGWKESGFTVKKGEKSKIDGITWLLTKKKTEDSEDVLYPKMYRLFHKSQVEEV